MQSSSLRWKSLLCAALVGMAQPACAADILVRAAADFATVELNQPWDMSDPSVVYPLLWTHNLQAATVSGRVFTGTPRDTDPHYWALYPQIPSSTATLDKPKQLIDASRYSKLSFYMWLPDTLPTGDRLGRVVWHVGGDTIAQFDAGYSESALFNVYPGWHLYTLDLASLKASPNQRWAGPWTGKMAGLRIDPCLGASATFSCNTPFKLAWVRLVDPADTGSRLKDSRLNKAAIVLSDAVDSSKSSIAAVAPGSDGSFDLSSLAPGSYKVAPIADDDYALFARGAAWDFKSLLDFNWASRSGWTLEGIKNGQFEGTLTSTGSALLLDVPASRPIDAAKYRYLRVKMDIPVLPAQTAGLLVYWGEQPVSPVSHNNFTPLKAGLNEYVIDLGQNATWTGQIRTLQINPLIGPNASGAVVKLVSVRLGKSNTAPDTTVAYLSDTVKVNNPPKINLLAPSFKSGNDYARTVLGQPWDMRSRLSTPRLDNLSSADFVTSIPELGVTGHFLRGTNTPAPPGANSSDPAVYLISQRNDKPIDASIYRLFRVKMYVPFNAADQNEL
uniref:hypothetical protein n=1 Tax=Chitinimonas sp. TaxID=1934313 RepID=UPI0035AE9B36